MIHQKTEAAKLAASGQWPMILQDLARLDDNQVSTKSKSTGAPCPLCGGTDRYSFKDARNGDWACRGCGKGGDGFSLLMQVNGWEFKTAVDRVDEYFGGIAQDDDAIKQATAVREGLQLAEEAKQARKREQAKAAAGEVFARAAAYQSHPYAEKKKLSPDALAECRQQGTALIIPVRNAAGEVMTVQRVQGTPDNTGKYPRLFHKGAPKKGGFLMFGRDTGTILIGEGLATVDAARQLEGSGCLAVCAFDSGNLLTVSQTIREQYPAADMVICADNDDAGIKAANAAASATGASISYPPDGHNDWSDYFLSGGEQSLVADVLNGADCAHNFLNKRRNRLSIMEKLAGSIKAPEWLVKNWFETDSMGCLVAPSYTGKSFLALDLACSVATGKPWQGNGVKKGAVVYIAGEGYNGIRRRLRAWEIKNHTTLDGCTFLCSDSPYALGKPAGAAELIEDLNDSLGHIRPALIVVDTVARNTAGREENSATDTGVFVATMDAVKRKYGCTILLVHHTGHGSQERGRGSSALYAAQDCEYLMKKDDSGVIELKCTKMKDGVEPKPINFQIVPVELGIKDSEGEEVTSAVLVQTDKQIAIDSGNKSPTAGQLEVITVVRGREAAGTPPTYQVLFDDLKTAGVKTNKIAERVKACVKNGWLREDENGLYHPVIAA